MLIGVKTEITYLYKLRWNGEIKEKKFYDFRDFGRWIAENITEIINKIVQLDITFK